LLVYSAKRRRSIVSVMRPPYCTSATTYCTACHDTSSPLASRCFSRNASDADRSPLLKS
jgi:hypothetical protein